ncbi:hypothetical protein LZ198_14275 [Myxococcus sp. K15C18031901]|uniref:hypothetical protein n=1 Tax=Myxococcus dinghuensis TaxID=2906761 RepID=UPI0020A78093|nr:hypothetical protein [Myxococcus dinghuensis]MCP3100039.1 hypothetical protein [Myxococcus dinghuensis]
MSEDAAERHRSWQVLVAAYWKPIYKHLRLRWRKPREDAKDLTQGFFAQAMDKGFFEAYHPSKARFRTFLRTCLDGFVANQVQSEGRLKRGGGVPLLSLDFELAEGELARLEPVAPESIERCFEQEWTRSLFALALDALRDECEARGRSLAFTVFERYDVLGDPDARPTYARLAAEYGIAVTDVTNHLFQTRRRFRAVVLDKLRELTATDEEFREEARLLLGGARP